MAGLRGHAPRRQRGRPADLLLADWIAIIGAFFATLGKRRIETPTERLAWLIIVATIPVGILGCCSSTRSAEALAKPLAAAIFLMVNGCILLCAERYRRRAEVRELARARGAQPRGLSRAWTRWSSARRP